MKELRRRLVDYACHHRKPGHDTLLLMLTGFAFVSCLLLLLPSSPFSAAMDELLQLGRTRRDQEAAPVPAPCAALADSTICCDRTVARTDVCVMRGDVRTQAASNSLFLLVPANSSSAAAGRADEHIRPYTRKWESSIMSTIDELRLRAVPEGAVEPAHCDVQHDVPAVIFSAGGYIGNVYHEFNDGIIPLYITTRQYNKKVVGHPLPHGAAALFRPLLRRALGRGCSSCTGAGSGARSARRFAGAHRGGGGTP